MPSPGAAQALRDVAGVIDVVPTLEAMHVLVDPLADVSPEALRVRLADRRLARSTKPGTHEIPVCYEPPYAPDLDEVASITGMTPQSVIELHSDTSFTVGFMGFAPGFGYLIGLPERLHVSRLASPRTWLEAGSVGIAGSYSGVYANAGPGGWRVIGKTAARLFDPRREPAALLRTGDVVRFKPVSKREFEA